MVAFKLGQRGTLLVEDAEIEVEVLLETRVLLDETWATELADVTLKA